MGNKRKWYCENIVDTWTEMETSERGAQWGYVHTESCIETHTHSQGRHKE